MRAKRGGKSFTAYVEDVEVMASVDVPIYAEDLTVEMIKEWVDTCADSDDLDEVFGVREPISDTALEKAYARGTLSMFEVVEFIKNHKSEIDLHLDMFKGN